MVRLTRSLDQMAGRPLRSAMSATASAAIRVPDMSLGLNYRKLWAGNAASNLGDGISFVAIPLLAAALTSDPVLIAGLSMVNTGARLLVVLPIGVLIDRVNRTTVLWAANLGRALLLATLALVVASGAGSIAVLYGVFALIGIMESAADKPPCPSCRPLSRPRISTRPIA